MSRWLPWLAELAPEMFCEVSPELAADRGLVNGGWATIYTARAALPCRVLVTRRIRPLLVGGTIIHQIGVPYHWGAIGRVSGAAANELFALVGDANVHIPESKVTTADIVAGRRAGRNLSTLSTLADAPPGGITRLAPGPRAVLRRDQPGAGPRTREPPVDDPAARAAAGKDCP